MAIRKTPKTKALQEVDGSHGVTLNNVSIHVQPEIENLDLIAQALIAQGEANKAHSEAIKAMFEQITGTSVTGIKIDGVK